MKFAICDDEEIYFDYLRSVISTLEDEEEIWIEMLKGKINEKNIK